MNPTLHSSLRRAFVAARALALPALAVAAVGAHAASAYPVRPVTLVVPFPAGGAVDMIGRLVGKSLGDALGQPVVIENRAGAGTIVGAGYVAKAAADGYTLLVSSGSTFTVNPAINASLPYDPVKSFEPVGLVARVPLIVLANKAVPVDTLPQMVAAVNAAPGKYVYGSFGTGTTGHFAGEMLLGATGMKLQHIPYKGSAPAVADLIGGQIPFSVDTVAASLPHIRSGKIKPIAVMGARRATLLPDVPTVAEAGYPGFDADSWVAIAAPRGLPADVKARLEKAVAQAMKDPEVQQKLLANGLEPNYAGPEQVSAMISKELPLMRATAQRASITAN
ncbi:MULTISPECIES: Bug family tripartite tricarboxylate transporter substrate binding protein [Cupriavidus]|uniref:Tripartite tricarboxylate transporter substrate binding protein n=1 Tax=Cupriavidus oxalaticus TaxID=96344 RepID=A0A4P7LK92_9BURK|nr:MULTISPECIES: tripartite tricarboxylate transporter substrate binding protein [Cupriavidus]MBF6992579.1 tripartite tricarboxylate transporter substrate binding protein [Cupriavidus sp. IK-TO18]QBY53107.1 tripartite tricarboxylate transporter substrate binding protein [Cupriavidus oxalaticus]